MERNLRGRKRRRLRIRKKVRGTAERPRLSVFRSANHIYVQVVDDVSGTTVASATSLSVDATSNKVEKAKAIGGAVAKACLDKGIENVVFDRGGYRYHGRVRALADGAREGGLKF